MKLHKHERAVVLMADDDPDDRMLTERAFADESDDTVMHFVENGEQLLAYLRRRAPYDDSRAYPRPDLVLLDLNMPRMDGRAALAEIKSDPALRSIPVVVLTTSQSEEDVARSYELAANSYITKPVNYQGFVDVARELCRYWLNMVELPAA